MRWQSVEEEVRKIAQTKWLVPAVAENVADVKLDTVLKVRRDYWILIEVSKLDDLGKLRGDVSKLISAKFALMARRIYAECYFVTSGSDHLSLRGTGDAQEVEVHSLQSFAAKFLGSDVYIAQRLKTPFGSAVNPDSGAVDEAAYTPIQYLDEGGDKYSVAQICEALRFGRKIVLLGEFGSGKSRCVMEAFKMLAGSNAQFPPIALNLRETYGAKQMSVLVSNHAASLGLGDFSNELVRSIRAGNQIALMDGFDEISSQPWSGDPNKLREHRKRSMDGIRDYLANSGRSGVLLTGREHYFYSNEEMAECFGLPLPSLLLLRCPEEFSDAEADSYIRANTSLTIVPDWMPRKPLICQLLSRLSDEEVQELSATTEGELQFFESVFDAICARETRINSAIYKDSLKSILLALAQLTRQKFNDDESISIEEINHVFFQITGAPPVDDAAQILQKLPYLGRTGDGGAKRIFVDGYAKDGLRGLALAQATVRRDKDVARQKWVQPLREFGLRMYGHNTALNYEAEKFAKFCGSNVNAQVSCDFVAARVLLEEDSIDFRGFSLHDGRIAGFPLIDVKIANLSIEGVEFEEITLEVVTFENVRFSECSFGRVRGVLDLSTFGEIFDQTCEVGVTEETVSVARISQLGIENSQKTLLAIIKKLFFQKGRARKEEALLRGAERYWDSAAAATALQYMLRERLLLKVKGKDGDLFVPQRKYARRMAIIMNSQSNSNDPLWRFVLNSSRV